MLPVKNEAGDSITGWSYGSRVTPGSGPSAPVPPDVPGAPERQDDATLAVMAAWDPDAFGELYDRYCDQIYRFAYRRLRDRQGAEDATADVFFKALRAIATYKPSVAPFSAWLYRIASNAVTDHLRARRPVNSLDTAMDKPDGSEPVENQAINRLEADRVWLAVDNLSSAQRTAVILRLGHDLPIAEIAALMERSEGAVKLLLNRGLHAVRNMLASSTRPTQEGGPR
jgi:RNA polymerase sigma-70 factor (ECF subfamily)